MANRAYLYTVSNDFSKIRDVSEIRSEVPLFFKILLGVDTRLENSQIWTYEQPIAISGDFEKGLAKYDAFLEYLKTQPGIDAERISEYQAATTKFFAEQAERKLDRFFMEGGEAYDLVAFEDYTIEKENEYQYLLTRQISSEISEILQNKPEDIFALTEKYDWIQEIKDSLETLEPYWTHVTYFSFNKSGLEEA